MRPDPVPDAIPAFFHFPPAGLALLGRGAVPVHDLAHLLAGFQHNIERLAQRNRHLHGHARGIVVDFLGGPGRDFRHARGAGLRPPLRLHQLGHTPGREILHHRDDRRRGRLTLAARDQTHPEHQGPILHTQILLTLW